MGARLPRSRKANYNCKFFSTGCYSPRGVSPRRRNFRHDSAVVFFLFSFFFFPVGSREEVSLASAGVQSKTV